MYACMPPASVCVFELHARGGRQIRRRQMCAVLCGSFRKRGPSCRGKRFIFEYQWLFVESVI